jgi:hypothetical protein
VVSPFGSWMKTRDALTGRQIDLYKSLDCNRSGPAPKRHDARVDRATAKGSEESVCGGAKIDHNAFRCAFDSASLKTVPEIQCLHHRLLDCYCTITVKLAVCTSWSEVPITVTV